MLVSSSNSRFDLPKVCSMRAARATPSSAVGVAHCIAGSSQIGRMVKVFKIVLNEHADENKVRDHLYV